MSRSGYGDELDWGELNCWRGAVAAALRGKRGQAFLLALVHALDALPEPKLIAGTLVQDGRCCALGAVAQARGIDPHGIADLDRHELGKLFGVAEALAAETMYMNDDYWEGCTEEQRFARLRAWALNHIAPETLLDAVHAEDSDDLGANDGGR